MSSHVQQKFTSVRKRLDQLGYRQPLGIESLPLVERLFADLLHTTESLKNAKLSSSRSPREKADVESQIEPYKNDNVRLLKENTDLHLQLIKAKEEADKKVTDFKSSLRKVEHENNDLRFLNNQYVHKVRTIEKESKEKSDQILKLQEKNFKAVIQTPGGKRKHVPFRRQRLLLDSTLPRNDQSNSTSLLPTRNDPFVAELLPMADKRIAELEREIEIIKDKNVTLEGKMATFRRQVESRDSEIDRLTRTLDGGRPFDVVALEARNRKNEELISHLQIQIEYLHQQNRDYERRLELSRRDADVADLERSRLMVDKETVVEVADRELTEAQIELGKSRSELENQDIQIAQFGKENAELAEDVARLFKELTTKTHDFDQLDALVDKLQQDKRKLSVRVNKLVNAEKELVAEIEKLKRRKGPLRECQKKGRSPDRKAQYVKDIEVERDYWKQEVDTLQQVLEYKRLRDSSPIRAASRSGSPVRTQSPNRTRSPLSHSASMRSLEVSLRHAEKERDYYKRECDLQNSQRVGSPSRVVRSPMGKSAELRAVMRERDELQALLDKFERQMAELHTYRIMLPGNVRQNDILDSASMSTADLKMPPLKAFNDKIEANVKVLTGERDRYTSLYEETKEELKHLRHQLMRSTPTKSPSMAAQHLLQRVEGERDEAMADLRRAIVERDTLRERLNMITETQIADRACLEQSAEDLAGRLKHAHADKTELEVQISSLRTYISKLEEEVRVQSARYQEAMEESNKQQNSVTQIQLIADECEKSLKNTQQRILIKEDELQSTMERCRSLEERLADSDRLCADLKKEINQLRGTVSAIDREKDNLQSLLDEKTERVARLDDECTSQEDKINALMRSNRDITRQVDHSEDTLKLKDREIQSLRKQIDGASMELADISHAKDDVIRENRLLEEDLANMTVENQRLNQDIQDLLDERTQLAEQMQEYVAEVKRVEDVLAQKEEERSRLLDQYRSLTLEAQRFESHSNKLEGEMNNLRMELLNKDSQIRRLEEQLDLLDRETQQNQLAQQALEGQISTQHRSNSALEERIKEYERERYAHEQDMASARDLAARLEHAKDNVQRRLAAKELECERSQSTVDELEREIVVLKDRCNSDRQKLTQLEQVLSANREREFQSQLSLQESTSEVQLMRDRITLNDSKIESQAREVGQLRNRIAELEADLEKSRRQVTNERFERERTAQELRRATELSSRSGLGTPSLLRSGQSTPVSHHTPIKVLSPTGSKASVSSSMHESANNERR